MKLFKPLMLAAAATVGMFATSANAGIIGSKHDFSSNAWQGKKQICIPCHAPHGANNATNGNNGSGPLWNHNVGDKTRTYTYTLYDASGNANTSTAVKLDANTMLCMSCHDGTIALDSFGGGGGNSGFIGTGGRITQPNSGTDLTGNHPMGSAGIYQTNDGLTSTASYMVDPYIFQGKKADPNNPGSYITDSTKTQNLGTLKPLDGKYVVGCTTCHEPHNRKGPTVEHMLWVTNEGALTTNGGTAAPGSGLCLSCHKK
jgi:hypothetical protein